MTTHKNAPAATEAANQNTRRKSNRIRKNTKLHAVIQHLVNGNRLHRFQAERICRDHVLNSTVSGFQREHGIPVARQMVTVPGYAGSRVQVAEYWLTPDAQKAAAKLLEV